MINIGIGIGWAKAIYSVANNIIANFKARVATYPNSIFEAGPCLDTTLEELNTIGLLDNASLVITPNAYNEGKLYDVVPNTTLGDMDVVRATTATRVNEQGLIEVVPRNLLTYSGDFSDASWVKAGGATITLSTIEPPFPNVQTYNLTNIGDSLKYISKDTETIINASYSFYLKAIDASDIGKTFGFKISNSSPYLSLELTDEWQRIDVFSSPLTGNYFRLLSLGSEATTKVCIAAAQLEQGSLTEYFPTTTRLNIPRIDYTNGTCPSLLVEPQRTNLLTYSNDFSNANWIKDSCTITPNSIISPDGTQNSSKLTISSGQYLYQLISVTSSNTYTISSYVKVLTGTKDFKFNVFGGGNNFTSGTFTATTTWQKFTYTFTATGTGGAGIYPILVDGLTGGDFYIYGAQTEVGSYATSYIPTVASTVTRNADVISKTGISSLIGQTEGTLFTEINYNGISGACAAYIGQGTFANAIYVDLFNGSAYGNVFYNGNSVASSSVVLSIGKHKLAIAYKNNDYAFFVDGVQIGTDNSLTIPSMDKMYIGSVGTSTTPQILYNNTVQLYKTRLSNSELAQLTTL